MRIERVSARHLEAWWTASVVVAAASAVASLVDGGHLLALLQAGAPTLGVAVLLLSLALAATRRWRRALVSVVAALVLLVPAITLPGPDRNPDGDTLSVLSFNTFGGQGDPDVLMSEIEARDVDVLVLPEMTQPFWNALEQRGIRDRLPHVTGRTGGGAGMIVATRERAECVELPSGVTCDGVSVAETSGRPLLDRRGNPSFDQIVVRLQDGTLVKGVHLWSPRLWPGYRWREQQGEMSQWIADHADEELLILAGDFNAGRSHPVFRDYTFGLVDSPRGEFAWTRTWPRWGPIGGLTHIDHVLVRGRSVAQSTTVDIPGSDHTAVWSLLSR